MSGGGERNAAGPAACGPRLAPNGGVCAPEREEQNEVIRADLEPQFEQPNGLLVLAEGEANPSEVHKVLGLPLKKTREKQKRGGGAGRGGRAREEGQLEAVITLGTEERTAAAARPQVHAKSQSALPFPPSRNARRL